MSEVKSLEQLTLVAAFIVPGLIALFARAQFLTGRLQTKDSLLTLFTLSLIWYSISAPSMAWLAERGVSPSQHVSSWFGWTIIGPAIFGIGLGLNASFGWTRRLLGRIGIRVIHVMPTAWDKTFSSLNACWVIVTMKDGSKVAGYCGAESFASSNPSERDLYIERMYGLDADDKWTEIPLRGVLMPGGEIRCIEFFPEQKGA